MNLVHFSLLGHFIKRFVSVFHWPLHTVISNMIWVICKYICVERMNCSDLYNYLDKSCVSFTHAWGMWRTPTDTTLLVTDMTYRHTYAKVMSDGLNCDGPDREMTSTKRNHNFKWDESWNMHINHFAMKGMLPFGWRWIKVRMTLYTQWTESFSRSILVAVFPFWQ